MFQYKQGYCDSVAGAATKSANYARQLGFSDRAVQAVRFGFAPLRERVCVYPQGDSEISRAVSLRSTSALIANRVWFIVVEESQLTAGIKSISRPKSGAVAMAKKRDMKRKTASEIDILAEEVALGFVIRK